MINKVFGVCFFGLFYFIFIFYSVKSQAQSFNGQEYTQRCLSTLTISPNNVNYCANIDRNYYREISNYMAQNPTPRPSAILITSQDAKAAEAARAQAQQNLQRERNVERQLRSLNATRDLELQLTIEKARLEELERKNKSPQRTGLTGTELGFQRRKVAELENQIVQAYSSQSPAPVQNAQRVQAPSTDPDVLKPGEISRTYGMSSDARNPGLVFETVETPEEIQDSFIPQPNRPLPRAVQPPPLAEKTSEVALTPAPAPTLAPVPTPAPAQARRESSSIVRAAPPTPTVVTNSRSAQVEQTVSENEDVEKVKRYIERRDVENQRARARIDSLDRQHRAQVLTQRYDSALMGYYIKEKMNRLLQSQLICSKLDKCSQNIFEIDPNGTETKKLFQ